ncbi:MAG: ABC transporter ATP-binding protein [Actinomycetia bacterium]|jgi:branched-chain amino acid transport system ATP-binding protein|nr:ABC transporter ATP-binding protein [Actinomycetes bacterium]
MLLKLDNVESGYGRVPVLQGISFEVKEGTVVTLLGANGAGKTTTLRAISGLLPVFRGTIEFDGQRINGLAPERITRRGLVHCPEGREVFPEFTVAENLRIGTYGRRDAAGIRQDLDWVMELFPNLKMRYRQQASTLSGGEQQMLAIGRALMARPRLLMLDEPSLGLSPILVQTITDVIRRIHQAGTTVLLVEQNVEVALELADFGYVLETGRIVLSGSAEYLRDHDLVRMSYLGNASLA